MNLDTLFEPRCIELVLQLNPQPATAVHLQDQQLFCNAFGMPPSFWYYLWPLPSNKRMEITPILKTLPRGATSNEYIGSPVIRRCYRVSTEQ